ncbi:MAG TPA: sporulation integral membrane protein YtvI [Lachnospiraceae bacterium]|nr:sporulation integral membrane protein YtvI [Lachnospiraceae bacterium]
MKKSTKYLRITINILLMVFIIVFFLWILPGIIVYFMPFVVAGIIALIANPLVRFMEKKVRIKRRIGSVMLIILVIALVVTVLYFLAYNLIIQLLGFIQAAPEIWESTINAIRGFANELRSYLNRLPLPVQEWSDTILDNASVNISEWLTKTTALTTVAQESSERGSNIAYTVVNIIMGILASYFFLAEKDYVTGLLEKYLPERFLRRWELVFDTLKNAVGGYFLAQLKIMVVVYIELFVGLLILKVKYSFLIAFLIALLDFLPFFGTGAVMIPWAVIRLIEQDYSMFVGLLIVWALGQALRQLIQPKLLGDSVGLEPLPTLFFLYIGFRMGGAFGLIIAVPLGMVLINLYKAGVFSNFKYSLILLFRGIEKMRRFSPEELRLEGIDPDDAQKNIRK